MVSTGRGLPTALGRTLGGPMPSPPLAMAGRIPLALAALAKSGVDEQAITAAVGSVAATVANVYTDNAPATVEALSARWADPLSIAAAAPVDMMLPEICNRMGQDQGGNLEAALTAAVMGQLHVLMAAIERAAQAAVGTHEPAQAAVPPLAPPPQVAVRVGDMDDTAQTEWPALVPALAPSPRRQMLRRGPRAKARKRLQRAATTRAAGVAGAAAAAAAGIAAQCCPGLSERESELWLPPALKGDPLGL